MEDEELWSEAKKAEPGLGTCGLAHLVDEGGGETELLSLTSLCEGFEAGLERLDDVGSCWGGGDGVMLDVVSLDGGMGMWREVCLPGQWSVVRGVGVDE